MDPFWPLIKGASSFCFGIRRKVLSFQTCFVEQVFRNSLSLSRYDKKYFRGRPHSSLMGPFSEIMVSAYYFEQQSIQLLFNNAFQNIFCFQAMSVHNLACSGPLTPYLRNIYINFCVGMKECLILNNFCSTYIYTFFIVFEIFRKEHFWGRPSNPLTGLLSKKMKNWYWWEHDS